MIGSGAMSGKQRTGNMKTFRCNCALMMSRMAIAASKVWAMGEGMVSGPLALWRRHSPPSVAFSPPFTWRP